MVFRLLKPPLVRGGGTNVGGVLITPHSDPKIPPNFFRAPSARGKLFLLLYPLSHPLTKSGGLLKPPLVVEAAQTEGGFNNQGGLISEIPLMVPAAHPEGLAALAQLIQKPVSTSAADPFVLAKKILFL